MKALLPGFALLFAALAGPAAAQVAGPWHVTGNISGRAFTLDCKFVPDGDNLGGVCVEQPGGKSHVLTKGSINGDQIDWSYKASYMMFTFDVDYAGTLSGGHMAGTATAKGRNGGFTATRQ